MEVINYLISFLLGSYTVATIDDLKRMSASVSFIHLWLIVSILSVIYLILTNNNILIEKAIIAIITYIVFSSRLAKYIFKARIAFGDYTAILPLIFLFNYFDFFIFLIVMIIIDFLLLRTVYVKIKKRANYPFMPAITLSLFIISLPNLSGISYYQLIEHFLHNVINIKS